MTWYPWPRWAPDVALLSDALLGEFLTQLPDDLRYTFEFRHTSWLAEPIYQLLSDHKIALCAAESEKLETPEVITADFVYYRLRKPEYSAEDRKKIADSAPPLKSFHQRSLHPWLQAAAL